MDAASTRRDGARAGQNADDEVAWFKALIYSKYIFVGRCRLDASLSDSDEFHLLQGVQPLIHRSHGRFLEALDRGAAAAPSLEDLAASFASELEALRSSHPLSDAAAGHSVVKNADDQSESDPTGRCESHVMGADANVRSGRPHLDWEKRALDQAFNNVARRLSYNFKSFASRFDKRFYDCFLYCEESDNCGLLKDGDAFPLRIDAEGQLRLCKETPSIGTVCENVRRYRGECRSKLSQMHNADMRADGAATAVPPPYDPQPSVVAPLSFEKMIVLLKRKVSGQSILITTRLWQLEGRSQDYISQQLLSQLKDLQDDVLRCPCDYGKWVRLLFASAPFPELGPTEAASCEAVYQHLSSVLQFASSDGLSSVFDLCIDVMFCIFVRHPNPCETLECCLNYLKTVLIPTLPHPCGDAAGVEEAPLWLPRLSTNFESLLEFEYISLQHPLLINSSVEETGDVCNRVFSTSVPKLGCYVLRVDISVDEVADSASLHKPTSPSGVFRICVNHFQTDFNAGGSVTFVSDGHRMMVLDRGFALIDLHSLRRFSFEFLLYRGTLVVYLNGTRFYYLDLCDAWQLDLSTGGSILISVATDDNCVRMEQPSSLTPGFRSEMMRRQLVGCCSFASTSSSSSTTGGRLLGSLYERHLFLARISSFLHNTVSRIRHSFRGHPSSGFTWSPSFVRYLRLLFEIVFCNLECVSSICAYFASSESANSLTLWRLISETILAFLSMLRISLSIPTSSVRLSSELLELVASCFIGCVRFRSILSSCSHTDRYHLQVDLDGLTSAINLTAVAFISASPDMFSQIFSSLRLEVLVDILVHTVSVDSAPAHLARGHTVSIDALRFLSAGDCFAIFTKRALSQKMSCFLRGGLSSTVEVDNHWWKIIVSFFESGKRLLQGRRVCVYSDAAAYCTCEAARHGESALSPFFVCCYGCLLRHAASARSPLPAARYQPVSGAASYYSSPRPSMLLCRLLLKHGLLFLCMHTSVSCKDRGPSAADMFASTLAEDYQTSFERFCDWRGDVLYGRDDGFLSVKNASTYFRMFKQDDVMVLEHILTVVLRYSEFVYGLIADNVLDVSSDFLSEFASGAHNFVNALSLIDALSYLVELFEHMTVAEGNAAVVHRTFVTCANLLPSILQVLGRSWTCIKRYAAAFDEFSLFMNYVVLQFHSLVYLLGKLMAYMYNHSKRYTKDYLLSKATLGPLFDELSTVKGLDDQRCEGIPQWLLRGAWLDFDGRSDLYASLKRLVMLLQDFKYDSGVLSFTPGFEVGGPPPCQSTQWAQDILRGAPSSRLLPAYRPVHPSLDACQRSITAVFIHLLGAEGDSVDFCLRYASQAVFQLMRRLQNMQTFFNTISDVDHIQEIRQRYVEDICARCSWVVANTRGGIYYTKADSMQRPEGGSGSAPGSADALLVRTSIQRSTSVPHIGASLARSTRTLDRGASDFLLARGRGRRHPDRVRSRSVEATRRHVEEPAPDAELLRLDIRPHIGEITGFLLHGPCVAICESELYSERLSTLCRYSMWRCMNLLVALIADVRILNDETGLPSQLRPLLAQLLADPFSRPPGSCSDGMHSVLKLFWYCLLKTSRCMVIRAASDGVLSADSAPPDEPRSAFEPLLLGAQTSVLEKLCSWYLYSGVCSMDAASSQAAHLPSWVRISLPFFSLLFSLGLEPLSNSRYATPIFQHLLSTLQPLRLNAQGLAKFGPFPRAGLGSIIVLFVSHKMLCLCNSSVNSLFQVLWSSGYSKRDFIKVNSGLLYVWAKSASDAAPPIVQDELRLRLIWSLQSVDPRTVESDLEPLGALIPTLGSSEASEDQSASDLGELIVWHMSPSADCDIVEVSFMDKYLSTVSSGVDVRDVTIPIYIKVAMKRESYTLSDVDKSVIHHLGGTLEVESSEGVWSRLDTHDPVSLFHPMRVHLHYLLRFLLWTSFSSNLYSTEADVGNVEISCCLCLLVLRSLRDVASMLATLNQRCDCSADAARPYDGVSFRYTPSSIDGASSSLSVEGVISGACDKCTTNVICRCEIENFWVSILTVLTKEIDTTSHYGMVNYILNCLLTTFTLGDEEIDVLLTSPNLGPAFCELFVACTRKLGQEHLRDADCVIGTSYVHFSGMVSPTLHGMFLYRWLPPLQRSPLECLYSSVSEQLKSILATRGYKRSTRVVSDTSSDPFSTLPHSDIFVTHRSSADFEADIGGNTLHVTRALNMGGIVLFRIPIDMGSASSVQGSVNFFILSPGRFGITVAPADCVFGSVMDLFDRNDVVGFMTSICPPFIHDVFAATINYRVGDMLSASFTVDQQDDGQVCLRTELLIAGNSIGSVLEVVYDPVTQNEPMRRMSLVFIFQDPQTIVYNGVTLASGTSSERLVSRETLSTFRTDTASEQPADFSAPASESPAAPSMSPNGARRPAVSLGSDVLSSARSLVDMERIERSDPSDSEQLSGDRFSISTDDHIDYQEIPVDCYTPLESFANIEWDVEYDVRGPDEEEGEPLADDVSRLCKDEVWYGLAARAGAATSAKSAMMFGESVQLYQALLITNIPLLSGLKDEVVGQMCLSFESLCFRLLTTDDLADVSDTTLRDSYSWLCVLGCDVEAESWKQKEAFNQDAKVESVSDFSLPWLLGTSSTLRSCASKINAEGCRKLLVSLSRLLTVPSVASAVLHLRDGASAMGLASLVQPPLPDKAAASTTPHMLAFGAACLLCCVLCARVLCEKGYTFDTTDSRGPDLTCVDQLMNLIVQFTAPPDTCDKYIDKDRALDLLCLLGVETGNPSYDDEPLIGAPSSLSASEDDSDSAPSSITGSSLSTDLASDGISLDEFWAILYNAVRSHRLLEPAVQTLDGRKVQDLPSNTRMFSTCDYSYHSCARVPSASRHTLRRTLRPAICEHDVYDLASVLVALCPEYFASRLVDFEQDKGLQIFRASVTHFVRGFDFSGVDYWNWGYMARSVKVSTMDQYSLSVDPLYGWQRMFYMEGNPSRLNAMLNVLFTELLYCIALLIHDNHGDQRNHRTHSLAHVVHWVLDGFLRHPLCSGLIRKRFVTCYVWAVLHTLLVNCSALPCKLAVVASRLSAWVMQIARPTQLNEIFTVTHYCGASALDRVGALCNFYNVLDLDTFTNMDLKRQDHAAKLASAELVHLFASTLSLLLGKGCDPMLDPDNILSIAHYLLIGKSSTMYPEKFIRYLLNIPQEFVVQGSVAPHYRFGGSRPLPTRTFVTSSRSRSLSLTLRLQASTRVVLCLDRECKVIISETTLHPDKRLRLSGGDPVYLDGEDSLPFDLMRQRCCLPSCIVRREATSRSKDAVFRIGFVARGIREVSSPSSKVHFENGFLFLEIVGDLEITQTVMSDEIVWHHGHTTVCLTLPGTVELVRPYISVSHEGDPAYSEEVVIVRDTVSVQASTIGFYMPAYPRPLLAPSRGSLRLNVPFRSGISMSDLPAQPEFNDRLYLDSLAATSTVDVPGVVNITAMSSCMALPFAVTVKVVSSRPDTYVGLEWFGLRYLWLANGHVQVPVDPPLFRSDSVRTSRISIPCAGFSAGDLVCLQFVPDTCELLFIRNGEVRMILDFRRFYQPRLAPHALGDAVASLPSLGDSSISVLHNSLFNAIVADDLSTVRGLIYFITSDTFSHSVRVSLLETPLVETQPPEASRKAYDTYNTIYLCCMFNRLEILQCISAVRDVDFDARSGSDSETPLMAAARGGCNEVISYLLCVVGVDVNACDRRGNTPLMLAVQDYEAVALATRGHTLMETVDLLVTFGADVMARNHYGCTVLDVVAARLAARRDICRYIVERYNMRISVGHQYNECHQTWPGLLGGCEFVCGAGGREPLSDCSPVTLQSVDLDGRDLLAEHCDFDRAYHFDHHVDLSLPASAEHIASILERLRKALLLVLSKLPAETPEVEMRFLNSAVRLDPHADLAHGIATALRGFTHDVKLHSHWARSRDRSSFVRIATDYCSQVAALTDRSATVLSFLNFERCVRELRLFSRVNIYPLPVLQAYRGALHSSNAFHCAFSLYSHDYLAVSSLERVSRYLDTSRTNRHVNLDFNGLELPTFSRERIAVTLESRTYSFDRIRMSMNCDVTKDIDFAIHCLADLLNGSPATKQVIAAMAVQCKSRADLQRRLPPTDSPIWNGIHTTVDSLAECINKLQHIMRSHISRENLDEVDMFMLLRHLASVAEDATLKHCIDSYQDRFDIFTKLREFVDKMQVGDVRYHAGTGSLRIINFSCMGDPASGRRNEFSSPRMHESNEFVLYAFSYVLVSDRMSILDHVNDTFRTLVPIVGTVLNQPLVEYLPLEHQVLCPYQQFVSAPPCWELDSMVMKKFTRESGRHSGSRDDLGICLGPPELPVHWSAYFASRCLIRRTLINDVYSKIFLSLQSLNRDRPYFSIRVDRGIAATASSLKHTLWYQSCSQILNCNPNILRARNNQRPFMVVFRGEGATDFGGPFQELLSGICNEVMQPLAIESRLTKKNQLASARCPNTVNTHGLFQDTVMLKFPPTIHPMVRLVGGQHPDPFKFTARCGDLGVSCSSGCCSVAQPLVIGEEPSDDLGFREHCQCGGSERYGEHCVTGLPMELAMYEALGRLFAMCVCMMNPLNVALNPVIWKKFLAANLGLKDLADCDKMSSDLLHRLRQGGAPEELLSDLSFSMEALDGRPADLLRDGSNLPVTPDNVQLFVRLATYFRLAQGDVACTWLARGFNAVLPIGRFRMLLDHKLMEFMVCGDPCIDLEVLRAHTVSSSIQLKRDLFDVLATFDNATMQLFLRFVSGRSRLPPPQSEWSLYVEYEQAKVGARLGAHSCAGGLWQQRQPPADVGHVQLPPAGPPVLQQGHPAPAAVVRHPALHGHRPGRVPGARRDAAERVRRLQVALGLELALAALRGRGRQGEDGARLEHQGDCGVALDDVEPLLNITTLLAAYVVRLPHDDAGHPDVGRARAAHHLDPRSLQVAQRERAGDLLRRRLLAERVRDVLAPELLEREGLVEVECGSQRQQPGPFGRPVAQPAELREGVSRGVRLGPPADERRGLLAHRRVEVQHAAFDLRLPIGGAFPGAFGELLEHVLRAAGREGRLVEEAALLRRPRRLRLVPRLRASPAGLSAHYTLLRKVLNASSWARAVGWASGDPSAHPLALASVLASLRASARAFGPASLQAWVPASARTFVLPSARPFAHPFDRSFGLASHRASGRPSAPAWGLPWVPAFAPASRRASGPAAGLASGSAFDSASLRTSGLASVPAFVLASAPAVVLASVAEAALASDFAFGFASVLAGACVAAAASASFGPFGAFLLVGGPSGAASCVRSWPGAPAGTFGSGSTSPAAASSWAWASARTAAGILAGTAVVRTAGIAPSSAASCDGAPSWRAAAASGGAAFGACRSAWSSAIAVPYVAAAGSCVAAEAASSAGRVPAAGTCEDWILRWAAPSCTSVASEACLAVAGPSEAGSGAEAIVEPVAAAVFGSIAVLAELVVLVVVLVAELVAEPVVEPVVAESVVVEPVVAAPVVVEPAVVEPVAAAPVVEPVVAESVVEPVVAESVVVEPVVAAPVVVEPAVVLVVVLVAELVVLVVVLVAVAVGFVAAAVVAGLVAATVVAVAGLAALAGPAGASAVALAGEPAAAEPSSCAAEPRAA
ncbi:HECT/ubiquitin-transferase domain containing protein, putative [Babesia caballi]|uniref:HECT/ubiquitin-transferase domain containing protein, putative n=1 Tax=Babesia caballi TaxID=5871 RepID=A0AAV4LSI7_BABCB|nr:HECT/ubiquitin-transferase domain containing protein, putative [Babesia caballi]